MDKNNEMSVDGATEGASEELDSYSQFFGSARDILDRYTHCALCGANLHFTHITDFTKNLTQETARCPECGIRVRRRTHRLQ